MTKEELYIHKEKLFHERMRVTLHAQQEYVHLNESAFNNFEAVADLLGVDRKLILMVYCLKHVFGIAAYIKDPATAQREDIRGRITDVVNYMDLLDGMVSDDLEEAAEDRVRERLVKDA